MRKFFLIIVALLAIPAIGQDVYRAAPLQLLTERIDEHDQQICDITERLDRLESAIAAKAQQSSETVVRIVVDNPPSVAAAVTKSPPVVSSTVVVAKATPAATARWKTASELRSEINAIRAMKGYRIYASVSPQTMEWVTKHLVDGADDHRYRYSRSQLAGLSYNDLYHLHSIAHSPNRISPYTSGQTVAMVETFTPTPRTPTPAPRINITPTGGCPNGRCPTARGAVQAASGWYPGKLIFGR